MRRLPARGRHYVFDLWVPWWRRKHASGEVIVVRYADDVIVGFERKADAVRFVAELKQRFRKFNLELHPEHQPGQKREPEVSS